MKTITGSGARSINEEDINNITKFTPEKDVNNNEYGVTYNHNVYYPTKKTITGYSTSKANRSEKNTSYSYNMADYFSTSEDILYKILCRDVSDSKNSDYWIASRDVHSRYTSSSSYDIRRMINGRFDAYWVGDNMSGYFKEILGISGVRPIVYLKSNILTSGKNLDGQWKIVEK